MSTLLLSHQEHLEGSKENLCEASSVRILFCIIVIIKKDILKGSLLCQIIFVVNELFLCFLKVCQADLLVKVPVF